MKSKMRTLPILLGLLLPAAYAFPQVQVPPASHLSLANLSTVAAGSSGGGKTLRIVKPMVLTENMLIPPSVCLRMEEGAVITISPGVTLTINGPFIADLVQAFNCASPSTTCQFRGNIAGNKLTLASDVVGTFAVGQKIACVPGLAEGATIVSLDSGPLGRKGSIYSLSMAGAVNNSPRLKANYVPVVFGPGTVKELPPEWWGANPYCADCTDALQDCINASTIPTVLSQTYIHRTQLYVHQDYKQIRGAGGTLKASSPLVKPSLTSGGPSASLAVIGSDHVRLDGICVDHTNLSFTFIASCSSDWLDVSASAGTIEAGQIISCPRIQGVATISNVTNGGVAPCRAKLSIKTGTLPSGSITALAQISDGILFYDGSNSGVVTNCWINSANGNGIHFYHNCNDALISNNKITNAYEDGIDLHSRCCGGVIVNNSIKETSLPWRNGGGVGIEVEGRIGGGDSDLQNCCDIVITGNIVTNEVGGSLGGQNNEGILVNFSKNITVANNVMTSVDGIHLIGVADIVICGNTLRDCWRGLVIDNGSIRGGYNHHDLSSNIVFGGNNYSITAAMLASATGRWPAIFNFRNTRNLLFINNSITAHSRGNTTAAIFCYDTSNLNDQSDSGTLSDIVISNNTLSTTQAVNPCFTVFTYQTSNHGLNPFNGSVITDNYFNVGYETNIFGLPSPDLMNDHLPDLGDFPLSDFTFDRNIIASGQPIWFFSANKGTMTNCSISGNIFKGISNSNAILFSSKSGLTVTFCRINDNRVYGVNNSPIPIAIGENTSVGETNIFSNNLARGSNVTSQNPLRVGNIF